MPETLEIQEHTYSVAFTGVKPLLKRMKFLFDLEKKVSKFNSDGHYDDTHGIVYSIRPNQDWSNQMYRNS